MTDPTVFGDDVQDDVDDILASHINNLRAWLSFKRTLDLNLPSATLNGGWIEVEDESWSYASATTITVPSGATSIFAVGDKIRLKQGGAYKYFYVTDIADTTLTVYGGTDYTVANSTITDAAFSKGGGIGHPGWFAYTPGIVYGGGTTDPDSESFDYAKFCMTGKRVEMQAKLDIVRGSGDRTSTNLGVPITPVNEVPVAATAYSTVAGVDNPPAFLNNTNYMRVSHGAMSSDGYMTITCSFEAE